VTNTQNTETPVEFVREAERILNIKFDIDLAADVHNHKAPAWFEEADNSLNGDWPLNKQCWLNPCFAEITKWCLKCEEQAKRGVKIVSIWPLSSDLNVAPAWKNSNVYIIHGRVWSLVRGLMMCVWGQEYKVPTKGLRWDKKLKTLTRIW